MQYQQSIMRQLEYVTNDHIAMNLQYYLYLKMALFFSSLVV